ncbi:glycosyltransferase family 4 protein [Salegentibacter sp. F188]|uniref:Glycosyltransferase family 4 protein n=1 Tax=Autumnicola patrickiae TaxID=3075591 RepID=A0ABU3DXY5_9FLAO|nr:glycosyltransferase family 4 protein [Salegentibacter sp. F188]MDT0688591.1 glycosyltransferase family 4 protein [Salegentibacter sp. F188]
MHLGFLTPEYPHPKVLSSAGIGTSLGNMVTALASEGVAVSVFVYGQKEDAVFSEDGVKFHLIRQRKFPLAGWYLYRKFVQNYLNKFIIVDKIEAIEAPDWTGITAFMKLRCPLVIRMHGSDAYFCKLEGRIQKKKNFWFEKEALKGADQLLSVSEFTAKQTSEIFILNKNIGIIPNSVDTNYFSPYQKTIEPDTLLYFGSLIRKKGILELAEIFNKVVEQKPGVKLLLLGKDVKDIFEERSTLELFQQKLSPEAKGRVQHIPGVSYEKIREYIASAAVVVLPSFAEALPMTWLEAMAMEKALVTSNIGWAKEVMIEGETGFTEDPTNHSAYAEKILRLLNDTELSQQMGKAARQQVINNFSTEVVVQRNIEFYRSLRRSPEGD